MGVKSWEFLVRVGKYARVTSKLIYLLSNLKPSLNFLKPIHKEMDLICSVLKCLKANNIMKELADQNSDENTRSIFAIIMGVFVQWK